MRGDGIIPTPLALTKQGLNRFHFYLGGSFIDDVLRFEVSTGQFLLSTVAYLVALLLTVIDVLAQYLSILTVTGLAGAVDLSQRRNNLVVAELHTTLLLIRHVTVGTRHAALGMDAML